VYNISTSIGLGTLVGEVQVTTHIEHVDTYEYAAWYRQHKSDLGRFPLRLDIETYRYERAPMGIDKLFLSTTLPSTITGNDLGSRFGGVACGKTGYNDQVGQRDSFKKSWPIWEVFDKHMFRLYPDVSDELLRVCKELCWRTITDSKQYLDTCVTILAAQSLNEIGIKRTELDGVRYAAQCIEEASSRLHKIAAEKDWKASWARREGQWDNNDSFEKVNTRVAIPYKIPQTV
jgi:hypothetical protein